jgi:hypothetical protein
MNGNQERGAIDRGIIESITGGNFSCPEGRTVAEVTGRLLPLLGSTDSHLREGALEILCHWGGAGRYSYAELHELGKRMASSILIGLGEAGTDSVFLRSFSALILEMVIETDDIRSLEPGAERKPFLSRADVLEWFEAALAAFVGEEDCRGFVDGQGWAHAIAHKADLLGTLARGRHLDTPHLERVLSAIAERLGRPAEIILAFEEEFRLVRTAVHVLLRNQVQSEFLHTWVEKVSRMPDGRTWGTALGLHDCDQAANRARVNIRSFLRSLYFVLLWGMRGPGDAANEGHPYHAYYDRPIDARDALLADIEQALRGMNRPMYKSKEPT